MVKTLLDKAKEFNLNGGAIIKEQYNSFLHGSMRNDSYIDCDCVDCGDCDCDDCPVIY